MEPKPTPEFSSHLELERKWLVDPLTIPPGELIGVFHIRQCWQTDLVRGKVRLRVITDQATHEVTYLETVKHHLPQDPTSSKARIEEERPLSREEAESRWNSSWQMTKVRRIVQIDGVVYHIDTCTDPVHPQGLVFVELEFADAAAAENFSPPPWLAGHEVTSDKHINSNSRIAKYGFMTPPTPPLSLGSLADQASSLPQMPPQF